MESDLISSPHCTSRTSSVSPGTVARVGAFPQTQYFYGSVRTVTFGARTPISAPPRTAAASSRSMLPAAISSKVNNSCLDKSRSRNRISLRVSECRPRSPSTRTSLRGLLPSAFVLCHLCLRWSFPSIPRARRLTERDLCWDHSCFHHKKLVLPTRGASHTHQQKILCESLCRCLWISAAQ